MVEGYRRRRAWAAFHAGYGVQVKDAKLEHLLGVDPRPKMTGEQLLAKFDAIAARHNARIAPPSND